MDASDEYRERLATIEAALALEDRSAANVVRAVGAEFAKTHKHLVAMLCDPALDEGRLRKMMVAVAAISDGSVREYDASAAVGKVLYDQYIEPLLDGEK